MQTYFQEMWAYSTWANQLIYEALMQLPEEDERCRGWFAHILAAQDIWLARLRDDAPAQVAVFPDATLDDCGEWMKRSHSNWAHWLASEPDFGATCTYQTTTGAEFSDGVQDLVAHVVNHGTHHRAQISARIRELGATPPATDLIFYLRTGAK